MMRVLIACLCLASASAADWYVAPPPAGANGNPGTLASPWATIAKALASSAAGDRILLQRGGTWRETFTIGGGRQLLAYGSGADPEITASQLVTLTGTWASDSAVRTAAVAAAVKGIWVAGRFQPLARYPNKGASPEWLRVDGPQRDGGGNPIAGTSTTADLIRDAQLPAHAANRWTGAQVRWRRWSWWWETRAITGDNGAGVLTLGANPVGMSFADGVGGNELADRQGSAYFIDNDLDELDAPGEWFWGGGTLYLRPPTGITPTAVEVATATTGIVSTGATITGIAFRRFQGDALELDGRTTISGCTFEEIEGNAIDGTWNAGGSTVSGSIFRDVRNVGISWFADPAGALGTLFERNLMQRIGMERGYGGSGTWHACGVIIGSGRQVTMRLNRLIDIGYCGVILGSSGMTVDRNVLVRTMQTLNDGAAVYTNCSGSIITGNIILDSLGDLSTSHPWWPLGHGIWPEFLSDFHDQVITGNTIYGCNGDGVVMDNEYTSTVSGNVIADCRSSGLSLDVEQTTSGTNSYGTAESADDDLRGQGHAIDGNIIATVSPSRRIVRPEILNKWWVAPYAEPLPNLVSHFGSVDYGTMSHSSFIVPASGSDRFVRSSPAASWTTLATWASANASWAQNGDRLVAGSNAFLLINDTEAAAAMSVPAGSWTLHDGTAVGATVTVPAFASRVLITAGSVPAAPYAVASGIDWRSATPTTTVLGGGPTLPAVTIVASDAAAAEPADGGAFTVTRSIVTASPLSVVLAVSGTASGGGDYGAISGTATIPANQASITVAVSPINDGTVEAAETVVLAIAADPDYAIGSPSSATVTIGDDDAPPTVPVVTISAGDPAAGEGGDPGSFTITRSPASSAPLTVNLALGGTAGNGGDYGAIASTVTIPASQGSATISVVPVDDALVEGSETVVVGIGAGSGGAYTIGVPGSATVTIADNDGSGGGGGQAGGGGGGGGCGAGSALAALALAMVRFGGRGVRRG